MAIIAKSEGGSGTFTPHPEGQFAATCVDVHDLGYLEVTYQGQTSKKHKVDIYFYAGENKMEDGKLATYEDGTPIRLMVRERQTVSLHPQSRMRPFLEGWRGKKFTQEEEYGFDLEQLIGKPALITVEHNESNGKTYANVVSITKLPGKMADDAPGVPDDYVRFCDRPDQPEDAPKAAAGWGQTSSEASGNPFDADDDDLPF